MRNPQVLTSLFTIGRDNVAMTKSIQSSTMAVANTFAFNGIEAGPGEAQVRIPAAQPGSLGCQPSAAR
jgi:hypothetical protein